MTDSPILVDVRDHVATVTINRAEKSNALTRQMWQQLGQRMTELAEPAAGVRAVILTGAGEKVFCAGADMREFLEDGSAAATGYGTDFVESLDRITNHPAPVIGMVQGLALGGGCQLALSCDFRIASDRAQLGIPAALLGLALPAEAQARLIGVVGLQRAREVMYLGRRYPADEALRAGLVDWVVPHDRLLAETRAVANEIARNAPLAVQAAKAAINATIRHGTWNRERDAEQLAPLDRQALACFRSEDMREGLAAFFGKRTPEFKGR